MTMTVFECPSCKQGIVAEVSVQMEPTRLTSGEDKTLTVTGRVTGLRISHDCIPEVTR